MYPSFRFLFLRKNGPHRAVMKLIRGLVQILIEKSGEILYP